MSEEQEPTDLDADTLMQENADIEFVVETDGEGERQESDAEPESDGGMEDTITIVVEEDDDDINDAPVKLELTEECENSVESIAYIDDYPELEEATQTKADTISKRSPKDRGVKRARKSDDESSKPSKKSPTIIKGISAKGNSSSTSTEEAENIVTVLPTNPCFVPGCQLPRDKKVYFFRVPRNKVLFQLWDLLINRPGGRLTSQCLVCQQHFHKDDILSMDGPRKTGGRLLALRKEALPCINYIQRCPVNSCGLRSGPSQQFPVIDKHNFLLWLERIGNPKLKNADIHEILRYRVCNSHFELDCFDKNHELKPGSVPSLDIPEFRTRVFLSTLAICDLVTLPPPLLTARCLFDRCADKARKKQNVYPLPSSFESVVKWLASSGHPNWISTSLEKTLEIVSKQKFGVCPDHFTAYDYIDASLSQLINTAVPTRKGDREILINYAVEVKNVVPLSSPASMVPTVPSANSMVILLPSSAPTGQAVPVSSVQAPMTAALPLQTTGTTAPPLLLPPTVPLAPQLVLPVPPQMPAAPGNMVPLLVSTQGDTKLMLVPQEVMKNKDPTTLQKMVIAATSVQSQPQATSTPSGAKVNILPKPINTTPKAIKKSPKIPMPKITPAMRRAAAAGLLPSSTIDLTESQETDDKGTESSTDLTETLHKEAIVSTDGFFDPYSLGMRRGCCYVGCKAEPSPQNPLYTFPVDPERRKAWLRACGRDESLGREWLQICKSHFSDESFHEMGYMLPNAVPHQNPLKAPTKVYLLQNKHGQRYTEIELTCPKRREDGMFPCAVLKCHSCYHKDSDEYKMYRFPNPEDEPDRFRAWYELVSHPTLRYSHQVLYEEFVVCERHFEKIYFKNGEKSQGLCDIAIPTWMVPGKRSLKILDYYKKTVEPYLKDIGKVTVELAESEEVSLEENLKTVCVLEKDRLNFLGMGSCLKFTKHELNKLGFSMYKMTKNVYAAIYDLEEGESIKVHTAIIIDDNDTCEKAVLRQILDSHLADEPKPALERA